MGNGEASVFEPVTAMASSGHFLGGKAPSQIVEQASGSDTIEDDIHNEYPFGLFPYCSKGWLDFQQ